MADWPPAKNASFFVVFPFYDSSGCLVKGASAPAACVMDAAGSGSMTTSTCTVTELSASAGMYRLRLTATEMNADIVAWKATTTTASARDAAGVMYTVTRQLADLLYPAYPMTELGQSQPTATPTVEQALMFHYMTLRNTASTSSGCIMVTNDAGTVVWKASLTDTASVFERTKWVAGP